MKNVAYQKVVYWLVVVWGFSTGVLGGGGLFAQNAALPGVKFYWEGDRLKNGDTTYIPLKEPVEIEAEGLKPNSMVTYILKKHKIRVHKQEMKANAKGKIEITLQPPDYEIHNAEATIEFVSAGGGEQKITFFVTAE